ncbi:MAG: hypothetical protein GTN84_02835 [Hydrogenophaga sp.]|uniref:HAD domain-containing protein n=1 Tax=Hydrogenophaga sp. TaxID=1904254 RepID=UPI001693127F|nr:HAD domain-containing protein [Hydrogenophaga sp.]NIM40380.1 hypothetical protein [Hydrogenophaga sp.]NIN25287.1 hypothetical protein [Hydrogenophaga sp.]NIN29854.1 hypothetical protein [Hydrogenophaga sp.]NIN54326.1 hypothetical protein [Hydrogenophaga sp.]NIO52865.1 hypothetical protein [Hydrogenophaga sp.]
MSERPIVRIIFLDIDGVLHPVAESADPAGWMRWLPTLEALLVNAPDVSIVVHSTWRYAYTDAELHALLGPLSGRILGSAPRMPREIAIETVLQANKGAVTAHLVLDDDSREFTSGRLNVLLCDPQLGISAPKTQAAITAWLSSTDTGLRLHPGSRLPKGGGELALYLDFDGVLHHENVLWHPRRGAYAGPPHFTLFEHAALLDELLSPYPEVFIVLSTSWVRTYGCDGAAKRLPAGLRDRVLGATFHSEMNEQAFVAKPRGTQVLEDVARRRPRGWLALDDTDEGWPPEVRDQVLLTDERLGIAAPGMPERIAAALKRLVASKAP